jgi:hypothetical protein
MLWIAFRNFGTKYFLPTAHMTREIVISFISFAKIVYLIAVSISIQIKPD